MTSVVHILLLLKQLIDNHEATEGKDAKNKQVVQQNSMPAKQYTWQYWNANGNNKILCIIQCYYHSYTHMVINSDFSWYGID